MAQIDSVNIHWARREGRSGSPVVRRACPVGAAGAGGKGRRMSERSTFPKGTCRQHFRLGATAQRFPTGLAKQPRRDTMALVFTPPPPESRQPSQLSRKRCRPHRRFQMGSEAGNAKASSFHPVGRAGQAPSSDVRPSAQRPISSRYTRRNFRESRGPRNGKGTKKRGWWRRNVASG